MDDFNKQYLLSIRGKFGCLCVKNKKTLKGLPLFPEMYIFATKLAI